MNEERRDKETRLLTIENKLTVTRGEVGGRMGEVDEGEYEHTSRDEQRLMSRTVES